MIRTGERGEKHQEHEEYYQFRYLRSGLLCLGPSLARRVGVLGGGAACFTG